MSNLIKLKVIALDIMGNNYMTWTIGADAPKRKRAFENHRVKKFIR